ncbi:hypothetical protein F5Y08DRAFT_92832 [Xylaria arbuscula]|nr:hypothetical protein F5Y08DRAFT_92832 [Xylaria arbuscula]
MISTSANRVPNQRRTLALNRKSPIASRKRLQNLDHLPRARRKDIPNLKKTDIPDHEESNESDLMQQQELPGELVSITSNVRPGADMRRSEITAQEAEDTSERQPAEALTSSPSEQIISGIIENKGDNGVSHPNPFSSQPVESLDRTFNQPTRPKSSQGLEQSKHTTPDQASSGYQFKSPKDHISKTTNTGSSTQGKETLKPTDPPRTPISDKTDLQESIQLTRDTRSPKTPERLPIKDRAASESAKTDCQSVDSRETVQPKGLPTTPDKPEPRQKDRPHDQLEFGQSAVSYFPEQSQPRVGSSSSNVIKRSQTPQHASQGHAETRFAKPPSPIQGDLVFSLDKDELDISPKSGKPMGFENIQNSNSEFLHVIGQQGQEKVTSPLPVENETVRGEDQLFDENKSVTDFSEHEEEPELLPHIPLEEQGQLVLFDSPFQPIFDDQGLTSLIGAFKKWETLIKEINEQTEGGHCQPFLLEFSGTLEDENYELLQNQSTIEADDIREDKRGKQPQQTFEASQPIPQASHSSESLVHLVDHAAVADKSSQSRSNSPPRSAHIADDQVPHFSRNGPIQSLCSNVLTGLVGSTTKSADMDSRNIPPVCADTPKRKLRSSSTESSRHKRQRGRQRHKSCQSPERDINPRGKLFQSSDNDIDIRSSWFKHSRRGLD